MNAIFQKNSAVEMDQAEASRIHNKGCFGEPQGGGSLKLNLLEALYLFESERLSVEDQHGKELDFGELLIYACRRIQNFELRYLVYSDLRRRGLIVNLADEPDIDFYLYSRGSTPKSSPPSAYVIAISERSVFNLDDLYRICGNAEGTGKEIILSVVDEEGDITYYRLRLADPRAGMKEALQREYHGIVLADRVIIPEKNEAEELRVKGFYGNPVGPGLQISMLEASYLMSCGRLKLINAHTGRATALRSIIDASSRTDPEFEQKLIVYQDLKSRGFIVKTGFKYGSHFRAYDEDPEKAHARYLIHAVRRGYISAWPEISRAVRLAHGVRKEILFGRVTAGKVDYIQLRRYIP
jgi:tRNA-intron endonuclease